jgi:hypothetical protein
MMSRLAVTGFVLAALLGTLAMCPGQAKAVVDANGIKILCGSYEVSKTYYGTLAHRMAKGQFKTIRWNIKKDEKTGQTLYHYATLVKVTPNGYDRSGKVNSASVLWRVYDEWKP